MSSPAASRVDDGDFVADIKSLRRRALPHLRLSATSRSIIATLTIAVVLGFLRPVFGYLCDGVLSAYAVIVGNGYVLAAFFAAILIFRDNTWLDQRGISLGDTSFWFWLLMLWLVVFIGSALAGSPIAYYAAIALPAFFQLRSFILLPEQPIGDTAVSSERSGSLELIRTFPDTPSVLTGEQTDYACVEAAGVGDAS